MSLPATISSGLKPNNFDEHLWVIQIRQTLDEELEEDANITVSIFNVPKILMATDPDCYIPQQIAFGPYHYFRPEMYEMERYKLAAAKRAQNQLENLKFEHLVEKLRKFEPRIRACYHRYLSFSGETFGWMMAVDACFLLKFLQVYAVKEGQVLRRGSSRMSHLLDATGRKSAHNAILRDMAMLENQIPMFLLRKMLKFQLLSSELADDMLLSMLVGLCKELLPFKMTEHLPNVQVKNRAHVLDFLYHMIVPETEELPEIIEVEERKYEEEENEGGRKTFGESSHAKQLLHMIYKLLSKLNHVCLDVNTGVILRNVVAYEACKASGPLVFTRYTELMNGIIDTEEDAKFLRERGIILNRLKSDEEVANLWNGMSKSVKLTKVPFLDKVIEDVNKYHSGRWKVKVRNFMKMSDWDRDEAVHTDERLVVATSSPESCGRVLGGGRTTPLHFRQKDGTMPHPDPNGASLGRDFYFNQETLIADFGGSAIGRYVAVNSGFRWIICLRSYIKYTRHHNISDLPAI
ncbi:hypothetical protein LguiA_009835 [Lonicera macranthoides]